MKKKILIAIVAVLATAMVGVVGVIYWFRPSDEEVLYAAGQVEYMGRDHSKILKHKKDFQFDLELYTEWAREDPEVQEQIRENRKNGR
jgi:hypothetical protein